MYQQKHERHFACPKPRKVEAIPVIPENGYPFNTMIANLCPNERRALREICESADVLMVDDRPYLLAPVSKRTLDALAAFEADIEDAENDLCDEGDEGEELDFHVERELEDEGEPDMDIEEDSLALHGAQKSHEATRQRRKIEIKEGGRVLFEPWAVNASLRDVPANFELDRLACRQQRIPGGAT